MDTLRRYHHPEANASPASPDIARLPELRVDHVEPQFDPLTSGERLLASLDDEALDQLASAMALQGISA